MIYLKSFLAGVVALILSVVLLWLGVQAFLLFKFAFADSDEGDRGSGLMVISVPGSK